MDNSNKNNLIAVVVISALVASIFGSVMGFYAGQFSRDSFELSNFFKGESIFTDNNKTTGAKTVIEVEESSAVVKVVEDVSPAVVSIIVTKDLPVIEQYNSDPFGSDFFRRFFGSGFEDFFSTPQYRQNGTEPREIGGGSGFLVSADGYIITNKHVVVDDEAEYTVLMNDESKHASKVIARDPINDLAILKIEGKELPFIELGDSDKLKVGQSVVAIGNALGEFRNTVSTGVISGLSRSIVAGGIGFGSEQLSNVIQTDASINPGNSGGPLLNFSGQIIGINTAIAQGAQNIGFAIPVNEVKNIYESVRQYGRIVRPWLGVRYVMINESIKEANKLEIDEGALIVRGDARTDMAVLPGSPADKAGLTEGDIITEIDGEKINSSNPLAKVIAGKKTGDKITLKVLSKGKEKTVTITLEEMKE